MNKAVDPINRWLNQQPAMQPPAGAFDTIMDQVHQHKRQRSWPWPAAAAAVVMLGFSLWLLPKHNDHQWQQLQLLTDKVAKIEQVVRNQVVAHSGPGSQVLEQMVSMETWLDQLDNNIAQSTDPDHTLELLHAKLEILDDLVALHKKIQPDLNDQII